MPAQLWTSPCRAWLRQQLDRCHVCGAHQLHQLHDSDCPNSPQVNAKKGEKS